jgi:hypothetical protein
MLLAVWWLVRYPADSRHLCAAGAVLAIAVGVRPALGLMALPCGLFVLLAGPFARVSFKQAAAFSIGFAAVIAAIALEVNRISSGAVRGLSANGGLNFYFAQCRTHEAVSRSGQGVYFVIPPATFDRPENGSVTFTRPFHDQRFFTEIGFKCVRAQPDLWLQNVSKLHDLFFGPLLPTVGSAAGLDALLPAFRWGALAVLCALPLAIGIAHCARRRRVALLLIALIAVSLATQYVFNAEHRYLYPVLGLMMALGAWGIVWAYRTWPLSRRPLSIYLAVLGFATLSVGVHAAWTQLKPESLIEARWFHTRQPFGQARNEPEGRFVVDTLRFPEGTALRHAVRGDIEGAPTDLQHVAIRFDTCLKVETPGQFEFVVVSDDGFELRVDERVIASHYQTRPYRASRGTTDLATGLHRYSLLFYQATDRSGVTAVWRRATEDGSLMPAVGLREVGEGGDGVRFVPPSECAAQTPK